MDFRRAKADARNSTYRHTIEFGFKEPIIGYSKKEDFDEQADKRMLLAGIIGRLALKSFDEGAMSLKIAKRNFLGDGTYKETPVAVLYPDGWEFFGTFKSDKMLEQYIQILYETQNVNAAKTVFKGYNAMTFRGTTYDELIEHCTAMKNYEPEERIRRFFDNVCKHKGWGKFSGQVSPTPTPAKRGKAPQQIGALVSQIINQE